MRATVLLENRYLPRFKVDALVHLLEHTDVEIALVAFNADKWADVAPGGGPDNVVLAFFRKLLDNDGSLLLDIDQKLAELAGDPHVLALKEHWAEEDALERVDALAAAPHVEYEPRPLEDEWGIELPADIVARIDRDSDVVINFEHAILKGDILEATEHGVVSFHASDITRYRGRPALFWQYLNDEDTVGVTLQQLNPELDGGKPILIERVDVSDAHTHWEMKWRQIDLFEPMLTAGIERLKDPDFEVEEPDSLGELSFASDRKSWRLTARIFAKNLRGRLRALRGAGADREPS